VCRIVFEWPESFCVRWTDCSGKGRKNILNVKWMGRGCRELCHRRRDGTMLCYEGTENRTRKDICVWRVNGWRRLASVQVKYKHKKCKMGISIGNGYYFFFGCGLAFASYHETLATWMKLLKAQLEESSSVWRSMKLVSWSQSLVDGTWVLWRRTECEDLTRNESIWRG